VLEVEQEPEAEACRRMRARAEGAAGIDGDADRVGRRLRPRRANPEAPDRDRLVELPPAIAPAGFDRFREDVLERGTDSLFAGGVGVRDERSLFLLEPLRLQLEEPCSRLFE
jgi:hypothetical protein